MWPPSQRMLDYLDLDFVPEFCVSFLLGELFLTSVQCNNGHAKSNAESHLQR